VALLKCSLVINKIIIVYHLLRTVESENPTDEYSCVAGREIFP